MLVLFCACVIILNLTNAQDYADNDYDDNGANSYGNSSCVRKYKDLESYVLNNEDLMDDLTQLYFETGETLTEFVRITYRFKILLPFDNRTNSTNDTEHYGNDDVDDEFVCIDTQRFFIWSTSALYLLGPNALFWQTLFAVHVRESSITIDLPCLCNDAYEDLLPRLTYLVSRTYNYLAKFTYSCICII